jgi:hypothetical protein
MPAKLWWILRRFWHYPHQYHESCKPDTFWKVWDGELTLHPLYKLAWRDRPLRYSLKRTAKLSLMHTRALVERAYYFARWKSGLCCGGGDKGTAAWRTDLCEWLERQARDAEDGLQSKE